MPRTGIENYSIVIVHIHLRRETDLAQITHVLYDARTLLNAGICRKRDGSEHHDDGDDNQKFDQREGARGT